VFDGKPVAGIWRLKVSDHGAQDTGTLQAWGTRTADAAPGGGCG
jgi:subtilisin-like proprotein convertase family protein